jgi:hypothetical protein
MKVEYLKDGIFLSQSSYIRKMLETYGQANANPKSTPLPMNTVVVKAPADYKASTELISDYQKLIGSLLYASLVTRSDICYAVGVLSRHTHNPTHEHMTHAKHVLRYLKGTQDHGLFYSSSESELTGYTDASYAMDPEQRKSISGMIFTYGGGPLSWASKKQAVIALSTCEAEYIALCMGCKESVWLRRLLKDFNVNIDQPTELKVDNTAAIVLAQTPVVSGKRTKHIDVRYHFSRECVLRGEITIVHCPGDDMLADIFTKPLGKIKFSKFAELLVTKVLSE